MGWVRFWGCGVKNMERGMEIRKEVLEDVE